MAMQRHMEPVGLAEPLLPSVLPLRSALTSQPFGTLCRRRAGLTAGVLFFISALRITFLKMAASSFRNYKYVTYYNFFIGAFWFHIIGYVEYR